MKLKSNPTMIIVKTKTVSKLLFQNLLHECNEIIPYLAMMSIFSARSAAFSIICLAVNINVGLTFLFEITSVWMRCNSDAPDNGGTGWSCCSQPSTKVTCVHWLLVGIIYCEQICTYVCTPHIFETIYFWDNHFWTHCINCHVF